VQRQRELVKGERALEAPAGASGTGVGRSQRGAHKKLGSAPQKRGFVAMARQRGLSQRRACRLARQWRSVARYRVRPPRVDEAALVERLKEIASKKEAPPRVPVGAPRTTPSGLVGEPQACLATVEAGRAVRAATTKPQTAPECLCAAPCPGCRLPEPRLVPGLRRGPNAIGRATADPVRHR
jgi:hypothetical protein